MPAQARKGELRNTQQSVNHQEGNNSQKRLYRKTGYENEGGLSIVETDVSRKRIVIVQGRVKMVKGRILPGKNVQVENRKEKVVRRFRIFSIESADVGASV